MLLAIVCCYLGREGRQITTIMVINWVVYQEGKGGGGGGGGGSSISFPLSLRKKGGLASLSGRRDLGHCSTMCVCVYQVCIPPFLPPLLSFPWGESDVRAYITSGSLRKELGEKGDRVMFVSWKRNLIWT